jgi:hypothetical protein
MAKRKPKIVRKPVAPRSISGEQTHLLAQHAPGNKSSHLGSRVFRLRWKRLKAGVITGPARMLDRRALVPHELRRARCLSPSLDTSLPHRMTATAQASGAWCWQRLHQSHTHGVARCGSPQGRDRSRRHGDHSRPYAEIPAPQRA